MKRIDLWKLLLVLPLTFTLSTPIFAEDAPAAPELNHGGAVSLCTTARMSRPRCSR